LPANLQKINTLEDYIPALIEMQKIERQATGQTDIYALSLFPNWDGDAVMFVKALGALYGYDEFGFCHYDVNTKSVKPYLDDGSMYLRCLKFFNTCFRAGILDPNSPTTGSGDAVWDKLREGKILFALFTFMSGNYNSEAKLAEGKAMYAVPATDMKPIVYGCSVYGRERGWAIGSKAVHPERIMQLIDWLCTPDGVMNANWGPKGLTWDYDKNNKPFFTDYGLKAAIGDKNTIIPDEWGGGKFMDGDSKINNTTLALDDINPVSGERFNYNFWASYLTRQAPKALAEWRADVSAIMGKTILTPDEYLQNRVSIAIGSAFVKASRDAALELKYKAVSTAIKTNTWLALMAPTEAEYNRYVAALISEAKAAGLDECVAWDKAQGAIRKAKEEEAERAIKK
jgi:putative aldouronate transport system substrate-binding protein